MYKHDLGEALPGLVEQMVGSYLREPRTQHIDREHLPSKRANVEVCDLLLELTYPGYIGRLGLTRHNIAYHVGELLPRLWELLVDEITRCLCHQQEGCGSEPEHTATPDAGRLRARQIAETFMQRIPAVRELLASDVQAAFDGDPAAINTAEVILSYPGVLAITIHRYAHELHVAGVPLMPRIMSEHAHFLTGIDIHPGAKIGRSFFIDHGTGVVIGETTEIGENVKIYQGVTLGALSFPKDARGRIIRGHKRHPTVASNVTIYAGATILGGDTVMGEGCVVGGGVFLTHSISPGHQVALGAPVLKVKPPRQRGTSTPQPEHFVPDFVI